WQRKMYEPQEFLERLGIPKSMAEHLLVKWWEQGLIGPQAEELDWRPNETLPEDYYALSIAGTAPSPWPYRVYKALPDPTSKSPHLTEMELRDPPAGPLYAFSPAHSTPLHHGRLRISWNGHPSDPFIQNESGTPLGERPPVLVHY